MASERSNGFSLGINGRMGTDDDRCQLDTIGRHRGFQYLMQNSKVLHHAENG